MPPTPRIGMLNCDILKPKVDPTPIPPILGKGTLPWGILKPNATPTPMPPFQRNEYHPTIC